MTKFGYGGFFKAARLAATRWIALSTTLGLMACTQYWAKPGGSPEEFDATQSACQAQSYSQFPPIMQQVQITAGYTTPVQTNCNGYGYGYAVNCVSTGGQYIPPAYVTVDQNGAGRNSAFRSCLFTAGWRQVKNKEEAEAVTNSIH
jgi:hypothetical protein